MGNPEAGKITEAGIQELRRRIGSYYGGGQAIRHVAPDLIRMYALGFGERNPLFLDEEYACKSRYGTLVAPPTFLQQVKGVAGTQVGGLPGVHAFYGGNDWEWYHAVRAGDRVGATYRPVDVVEKPSAYAGRLVIVYAELVYRNQRNEVVARARGWSIRTERQAARERGKYRSSGEIRYGPEQLRHIWEQYSNTSIRGAETRYWEDVEVGEELPSILKGPLRVVDVAFAGPGPGETVGVGAYTRGAHWYAFDEYRKHGQYAVTGAGTGILDHPHRGHWEKEMAAQLGLPGAYDLGPQRAGWLAQVLTNWMGDEGFLRRLYFELRRFNVEGDTTRVWARVVGKSRQGQQHIVECQVGCQNQRDEVTAQGHARVVLPARRGEHEVPL